MKESGHDHVSHQARAALIGVASNLVLARDVLTKTDRRSYRHIWEEVKSRFTHVGKTPRRKTGERRHKPRDTIEKAAASMMLDEGRG